MCGFASRAALSAAISLLVFQAPAHAGNAIAAWVSAAGQNVSGCGSLASPCRTFQYAHDNALGANGGDILVQGAGNYGPLNITKAVAVINDGAGTAGTGVPANGTAITVNTSGNVLLKGLTIDGVGGGADGVYVVGPGNVTIASCTVQNFSRDGVRVIPSGNVNFSVVDTLIKNANYGVAIAGSGSGTVNGNISNAKILDNATVGVAGTAAGIQLTIADTLVSQNSFGLRISGAGTVAELRHSTVNWNTNGGYTIASPSVIGTYGDNVIADNGPNLGTLTTVSSQ